MPRSAGIAPMRTRPRKRRAAGCRSSISPNLPNSVTLANTLTRVQHLAHAVHLQHRLRDQRRAAGRQPYLFIAGANVAGGAFRIYSLANPVSPDARDAAARGHRLHARLDVDAHHRQPHHAVRERAQPLRGARGFQRDFGRSLGRHGQGGAGAPVVRRPIPPRPTCTRAGPPRQHVHRRARRARRAAPRAQHAHLYARHRRPARAEPRHLLHRRHDVHRSQRLHASAIATTSRTTSAAS